MTTTMNAAANDTTITGILGGAPRWTPHSWKVGGWFLDVVGADQPFAFVEPTDDGFFRWVIWSTKFDGEGVSATSDDACGAIIDVIMSKVRDARFAAFLAARKGGNA
jgi:hypothetical protein